jgi:hypothetical protein
LALELFQYQVLGFAGRGEVFVAGYDFNVAGTADAVAAAGVHDVHTGHFERFQNGAPRRDFNNAVAVNNGHAGHGPN